MNTSTRAAIYARVSLDATGEGLAVERQQEACQALAVARGWTVVETIVDNSISAYGRV
ncbi:MAG TPA: recombinase family protein, partial [Jatrophihabitans sp.]